jgi:hypothetical protein
MLLIKLVQIRPPYCGSISQKRTIMILESRERLGEELKAGHSNDRFPAVPKLIGEYDLPTTHRFSHWRHSGAICV